MANWIRESACGEDGVFESGDAKWYGGVDDREKKVKDVAPVLVEGVLKRKRVTPSGEKVAVGGKGGIP